jgi:hypothetical protein
MRAQLLRRLVFAFGIIGISFPALAHDAVKIEQLIKEVEQLKADINDRLKQLHTFQQGDEPGFDASAAVGEAFPGTGANCPAGYFVAGLESYVERGDRHLKVKLKCWRLRPLAPIP